MKRLGFLLCFILYCAVQPLLNAADPGSSQLSALTPIAMPSQLNLAQAEAMLLQRSLLVVAGRQQLEVSQALRQIAGYRPNPYIQIGAEQFPVWSPLSGSFPRFFSTNNDAGANPTWTGQFNKVIERGGKRESRVAQADAQISVARAQVLDSFRVQLYQLRQAFAAAMLARENLQLDEAVDQQYQKTEDLTIIRVKAGDQAEMEVFRVKAGRLQFKQAILDARAAYQQAIRDIMNLLNARADEVAVSAPLVPVADVQIRPAIEIQGTFSDGPIRPEPAALRQIALAQRPDVQVARNNLLAAEAAVRLAEGQRSRDISVGLEYQRVGSDSSLGVIAQIPVFLYNNQKAGIAQAVALQRVAEAQLHQAEAQVVTDVAKAYQAYLAARSTVALYSSDNLIQVERLRATVAYSYQRGEASLFELLDAERTSRQAAVAFNQARANYQLSLWQMEAALGQPLN